MPCCYDKGATSFYFHGNLTSLPHQFLGSVPATVDGPDVDLYFSTSTMYPALSTALGPDVMLDFSGSSLPVMVRSADDGDLTTVVMPVEKGAWQ